MRKPHYQSKSLVKLFTSQTVAALEEIKRALGTDATMTVFRKLKELGYCTSYSHRGKYYALRAPIRFDERGLWFYREICFSQYGTLISTVEVLVNKSEVGYFTQELDKVVHVNSKETLLHLFRTGRVSRERISGLYLYCAVDVAKRKQQIMARRVQEEELILGHGLTKPRISPDQLKAAIILFYSLLDEKERRLYAGLESLKQGYGGDRQIGNMLGIDVHTVARGRKELLENEVERERIRKDGGGRKPIKKNARSDFAHKGVDEI